MRFLVTLSLPNCLDCNVNQDMPRKLNAVLNKLRFIQRLSLSYCNLKNQLAILLANCRQNLTYLNLKDARLSHKDIGFLMRSRCVFHLRELNLSCNDFRHLEMPYLQQLFRRMPQTTCLSLTHCQLSTHQQVLIARECNKSLNQLKVLSIHGYTPLSSNDYMELLKLCAKIPTLQKAIVFPKAYGFPGDNQRDREINRLATLRICYRYLTMRGREDIELE